MTLHETPFHKNVSTGTAVGLAEVYFNHPLWVIKTRMQCGYPFTANLRVLYRGAGAEALTMVPIDVIQMIVSTKLNERVLHNRFAAGFCSGVLGGVCINVVEWFMTLQQKYNSDFRKTCHLIHKQNKFRQLTLGGVETSLRNGIYNLGFFALAPAIDRHVYKWIKDKNLSIITSGALSGIGVTILSHPPDVIKTMRHEAEGRLKLFDAVDKIYRIKGVRGFFTGIIPRGARVVSGISIMSLVYKYLEGEDAIDN